VLLPDVAPHVQFGPVRQRKHANALARTDARVVKISQLGALVARVPLAELVADGEHALLGAGLLLLPPRAAEGRVEQRPRFSQPVPR
jgi:hypothetical protein